MEVLRVKKRVTLSVAMVAALSIVGTPAIFAQDDEAAAEPEGKGLGGYELEPIVPGDFGLVAHSALVEGEDRAYWIEQLEDWFALTPFPVHYGPQGDCQAAQDGPVFYLSNIPFGMFEIYNCTIEADKHILINVGGGFGFGDEPEDTLEAVADMALDNSFAVFDPLLIVDGQEIPVGGSAWHTREAKVLDLPEDNLFGVPPGEYNGSGNGWYVMLEPLEPGRHTILIGDETLEPVIRAEFGEVSDPPTRGWETKSALIAFDIDVPDPAAAAE
jgi:hypothetical protein